MEKLNRIKEVIVSKDKSQTWLAEQLGKSRGAVAQMCNNHTQPHISDLKRIADLLEVDIRELLIPTR
jgi:transcriptional regulator with XRE-family HTH domain